MAIIIQTEGFKTPDEQLLNLYPDQEVSQKKKESPEWIKRNMDYFYTIAVNQFARNRRFNKNYELVKGILTREDYNEEPEVKSFIDNILKDDHLPSYVKHYSIITPVINDLVGECTNRPDNIFVKAFDEDSKSEELEFKTNIVQQYIISKAKQQIQATMASKGVQMDDDQEQQMTDEKVKEYMTSYTSLAERWGNRVLEVLKMRFSLKEKSEDAMGDLLKVAREFYHIFEDNSEIGFNIEVVNPKNVWFLTAPDQKYISDPLDRNVGAYAAGTIEIMEISEIIQKYHLTKEELDYLRDLTQQAYLLNPTESNLFIPNAKGSSSIKYDTYDRLILQTRMLAESQLKEEQDELLSFLGITNSAGTFGSKYMVVRAYWNSKKKIGNLKFIDETGVEQTVIVDENYKKGMHPQEISLEWGWINQWYQGVKIGQAVYYVEPLNILDYCPIIGAIYEGKNLGEHVPSLVDMMKPYQILYNVAINNIYRLLEKDLGLVYQTSIRHIPTPKDGAYEDAIQMWEEEVRETGMMLLDDSPENTKAQGSNITSNAVNLSRAGEIEARYKLATYLREECWRLVGISDQRLGSVQATETATGTNAALKQSYAQTESWFAQHEYVQNKVYQALLDAALYIESSKPQSTISYITSMGESAFVQINGSELKLKELGVFVTSRSEDAQNFKQLQSLSQAMLQNGASPYEISVLYDTKSIRQMKDIFKALKDKQDQFQQQEQQQKQQQLDQQQKQAEQAQQLAIQTHQADQQFQAQQNELDRLSKEKQTIISAQSRMEDDSNGDNSLALDKNSKERMDVERNYQLELQKLSQQQQQIISTNQMNQQKLQLENKKLDLEHERTRSQERLAKIKTKKDK